jgi:hypothetical protein
MAMPAAIENAALRLELHERTATLPPTLIPLPLSHLMPHRTLCACTSRGVAPGPATHV